MNLGQGQPQCVSVVVVGVIREGEGVLAHCADEKPHTDSAWVLMWHWYRVAYY